MAEEISKGLGRKILDKLSDHDNLFKNINNALLKINNKLIDHDDRFEKLETNLKDFALTHFDRIYKRLDTIEQELKLLNSAVKRLEERMDRLEKISREEIDAVKKQVMDLLSRIEKLEAKVGA